MPVKQAKAKPVMSAQEQAAWRARHNVPLAVLAQDADRRFRPSAKLRQLADANWVMSY
jgi:hypothetical protein